MKATQPEHASQAHFRPGQHLQMMDEFIHDPYEERTKLAEPAVCRDCGAVFHQGRWQWKRAPAVTSPARCAACRRIKEKQPAGYVTIEGQFARDHRDEMLRMIRHLATREKAEHPLQRIMAVEEKDGGMLITTTDIHLARGIGSALQHAYKGELDFHYNEGEYLLRVHWERQE